MFLKHHLYGHGKRSLADGFPLGQREALAEDWTGDGAQGQGAYDLSSLPRVT